ncbi:MAG: glycosyltransferase family 2 protein, partial [Cyanobacteria bacterium P01_E01_bin.42]
MVVAIALFPIWTHVFTERNVPVEVELSAPGVEIVRAYWDDPNRDLEAYEPITVKPVASQQWNVQIEALGENNPDSRGFEVAILDIRTPQNRVDWYRAVFAGEWEMRDSPGSPQSLAAIAHSNKPEFPRSPGQVRSVSFSIEGGDLEFEFLSNPGSGKVRITANGQIQTIDLFKLTGRHQTFTFFARAKGDLISRQFPIKVVDTPWRKLKFIAEGETNPNIEAVKARNHNLIELEENIYQLPFRFWNRLTCSLVASAISFFIAIIIFISTVHLWQGNKNRYLGKWSYILSLSLTLAGFWTLVYYPALMSPDSLNQWQQALANSYDDWHPPLMTLGMRATQYLTSSPALFAIIQGFCFFASVYLFVSILLKNQSISSKLQIFCFSLIPFIPLLWNYSVTLWKDVWICTSLLLMLCCLFKLKSDRKILYFFLYCILFSISLHFRKSVIFYFPFFIFEVYFILKKDLKLKSLYFLGAFLISIFIVFGFTPTINSLAKVQSTHQEGKAFLYDVIGTYLNTSSPRPESFQNLFKEIKNEGKDTSYQELRKFYSPITGDDYVWHENAIFSYTKVEENRRKILQSLFIESILKHPQAYLAHKMEVWSYMLGYRGVQYPYEIEITKNNINLSSSSKIPQVNDYVVDRLLPGLESFFLPRDYFYLLFVLMTISWTAHKILRENPNRSKNHYWSSLSVAFSFAASFLFVSPVVNFRYLFASCVILFLLTLVEFTGILEVMSLLTTKRNKKLFQLVTSERNFHLLSIIVPVFNEEKLIFKTLEKLNNLNIDSIDIEIIIVDDCSQDNTALQIQKFLENHDRKKIFISIRHEKNRGKGGALKTGFGNANGDILIVQDADLEYDSDEIPSVIEPILQGKADVVYGSRFMIKKASRVLYYYHYLANKFLTFLSNLFTNMNMTDIETGYKAFRSEIIKEMIINSWGFGFEVEVTAKIAKLHCRVYEVPISYYGRTYEEGK